MVEEGLLDRRQFSVLFKPLHCCDMPSLCLHGENGARFDCHIIDQHRAGPTGDRVATPLRSGQTNVVSDNFHEKGFGVYIQLVLYIIYYKCY